MKRWVLLPLAAILAFSAHVRAQTKCQASVNGYRIKTVFVTGNHYSAVIWAYKHLSDETCLTPVTDPAKADAILDLPVPGTPDARPSGDPPTIACTASGASSICLDSDGDELDIDCKAAGDCKSYYGPSPAPAPAPMGDFTAQGSAPKLGDAYLYTPGHKLLWKSDDQKARRSDSLWYEKLRAGTNSPVCPKPGFLTHYKNFRQLASERCQVEFDPPVSIDLKANARLTANQAVVDQEQSGTDEMKMKRISQEAAAKQRN